MFLKNSQKSLCWIRQPFFFVARWRKFATKKTAVAQVWLLLLSTYLKSNKTFLIYNLELKKTENLFLKKIIHA